MALVIKPQLKEKIICAYEANMAKHPQQSREVAALLQGREEAFRLCLQYLYGHMHPNDLLSQPVELFAGYVDAALQAWESLAYASRIPQEIWFPWVLYHRVNSECLDGSRCELMQRLLPHVQGKTMEAAALTVNAWCYAHATYTPADDRTLGPLAVLRRKLGRCGEESVLAVAALRSVGIPARQCYCPRWSHCDDNHAWVEVWVDGDWHYLGACEPEPTLDRGWFTAAASRAMLVHTKQWSDFGEAAPTLQHTPLYSEISCTARYADVKTLTVQLLDEDAPVPDAEVAFQIVNYSQLYTLYRGRTDAEGRVQFTTGLGDLCLFAAHHGKMALKKVDLRLCGEATLELGQLPDAISMDLVPPVGRSDIPARAENAAHQQLLRACEAHRASLAAENPEVAAFLADDRYPLAEKEEILQTLRPKDLVDISREVLFDALDTARPARGQYSPEVYRDYILAPRIADEMLLPERARIRALFPDGFADPAEIHHWMQQNMQVLEDYGITDYYPSAWGCLRSCQVPAFAFDYVFVALCRAFRFPARLHPATGAGQWLDRAGKWQPDASVILTLRSDVPLHYGEHFSISRWNGRDFVSLKEYRCNEIVGADAHIGPPEMQLDHEGRCRHRSLRKCVLEPGLYRILTTTRQIDGTASVIVRHIQVEGDMEIQLQMPADQTAQRLLSVPLALPEGPVREALAEMAGKSGILMFAEPGQEPTEHLLQELLECADSFRAQGCPIAVFVQRPEELENPTLRRVLSALPGVQAQAGRDPAAEAVLHRLLHQGDQRLPFVVSVDDKGRGVYASANYQIRMAQTLLRIQTILLS